LCATAAIWSHNTDLHHSRRREAVRGILSSLPASFSASKRRENCPATLPRETRRPEAQQTQRRGFASNEASADRFAANVLPVIERMKASPAESSRAIAKALNARGIAKVRGGIWTRGK
jgi:hypothetical protein